MSQANTAPYANSARADIRHRKTQRRLRTSIRLLLGASSVLFVSAGPPPTGLEGLRREVSDNELSDMRGKFVRADSIHFFGVELVQSWQSSDGVTLLATLQFNVDFANSAGNPDGASPTIQISWDRICKVCADPSMDVSSLQTGPTNSTQTASAAPILSIGKFGSIEGLVQTQEIAGSDNDVRNALNFSVVPTSSIQSLPSDETPSIASSVSHVTGQGETVDFRIARNELGIALNRGNESVRQGISGELNQAAQHVIASPDRFPLGAVVVGGFLHFGCPDPAGADGIEAGAAMAGDTGAAAVGELVSSGTSTVTS